MQKKEKENSETGCKDGQYPFVLYNRAVLPHKTTTKLLIFVFSFDLSNKENDSIVGSLVRSKSRVLMTFIIGSNPIWYSITYVNAFLYSRAEIKEVM